MKKLNFIISVLTLIIFIFIIGVSGMYFFNKKTKEKIINLEKQLKELKNIDKEKQKLLKEITEIEEQAIEIDEKIPKSEGEVKFSKDLAFLMFKYNFKEVNIFQEEKKVTSDNLFKEIPFKIEAEGSFFNLINFLKDLWDLERLVFLKDLEIAKNTEKKEKLNYFPQEKITLRLLIYSLNQ